MKKYRIKAFYRRVLKSIGIGKVSISTGIPDDTVDNLISGKLHTYSQETIEKIASYLFLEKDQLLENEIECSELEQAMVLVDSFMKEWRDKNVICR